MSATPVDRPAAPSLAFWPGGARLAISFSIMFEGGGQPISGASGPITEPIKGHAPDLPTNTFFEYGPTEGIPRLLDFFDGHGVKTTSFMIGEAVEKRPDLAAEIVRRGHEAAAHGRTWTPSYDLSASAERDYIADGMRAIEQATGQRPIGWNAYWLRNSVHTLEILQDLGCVYHIDDISRDEPFCVPLKGGPFLTVPYTIHLNDIASYNYTGYAPSGYEQALTDEFDQLYAEGAARRRLMVVSCHDRINGRAGRIRVLDRFVRYAKRHEGVWFARKDEIARWVLGEGRALTPTARRGPAGETGLPGPAH